MIILDLFWNFLKVGCFSFGGAYSAIPLIRQLAVSKNWMTEAEITDFIAVSESTPGSLMVNMATYVGSRMAGIPGALAATFGVVLPAFLIIYIIARLSGAFLEKPLTRSIFRFVRPCVMAVILFAGIDIAVSSLFPSSGSAQAFDWRACIIMAVIAGLEILYAAIRKKSLSPIIAILAGAAMGIAFYREMWLPA
ncbi:MAG: chromate transporter [Oscillospiraceae bacterium]|jgi:chromate transporter